MKKINVLLTGSKGFIGTNLLFNLKNFDNINIITYDRKNSISFLKRKILISDVIIHLAGINRPKAGQKFEENFILTKFISDNLPNNKKIKIIFSSTFHLNIKQYSNSNQLIKKYSKIKALEEKYIIKKSKLNNHNFYILRLPHVTGKWSKPNYNSVVSTFCYNIANNKKSLIKDLNNKLNIISVEEVVVYINKLITKNINSGIKFIKPNYKITVGELYKKIMNYKELGSNYLHSNTQSGLDKILYSVFISFLPTRKLVKNLKVISDYRGTFSELFKTKNSGQFSYFTIKPGGERGGHYHNNKVEKFYIIKGKAQFDFYNLKSKKRFRIISSSTKPQIIYSQPGLYHSVKNIGKIEVISLLWSSEIYDKNASDTYLEI